MIHPTLIEEPLSYIASYPSHEELAGTQEMIPV
jgi:hypothetical protein